MVGIEAVSINQCAILPQVVTNLITISKSFTFSGQKKLLEKDQGFKNYLK
jgi:hypothetical protein